MLAKHAGGVEVIRTCPYIDDLLIVQNRSLKEKLRLLREFRNLLDSRPGLRMVPDRELDALFKEPPTRATEPLAQRAHQHLKKGKEYSESLKPKQAITEFKEALRILRAIVATLTTMSELEEAHLHLGMTYQALGQERRAAREYRMVLLLWSVEGLSYKEIAAVCDCALGTVMSRLYRARQLLWRKLRSYAHERKLNTKRFES